MKKSELSELRKLIHALIKRRRADLEKRFALGNVDITPFQYTVLKETSRKQITLNDIARRLVIQPPSLVPAIDALEKAKLIKRKKDLNDRRKTQLHITHAGLNLLKKLSSDDKNDVLHRAFHKLTPIKRKHLLSLLQELTHNFPS